MEPGQTAELPLPVPPAPEPTATPTEEPTATPTEEPAEPSPTPTSPRIVPRGGSTAVPVEEPEEEETPEDVEPAEVTEEPTEETAPEEPTEEAPPEETEATIEQTEDDVTPTTEVGGAEVTEEPTEEAPPTEEVEAGPDLGDADVIAPLSFGPIETDAPLVVAPGGGAFAYYVNGTELAVGDFGGGATPLGASMWPYWSPGGVLLYAYPTENGTAIAVWAGGTVQVTDGTDDDGNAVSDIPAGWLGSQLYYLRTFPDEPNRVELHSAGPNGEGDTIVWADDDVGFAGQRPIAVPDLGGVLIPTGSSWLLVAADGSAGVIGENPYGAIGEALISPGGSRIAYVAGGQLIVAEVGQPGSPMGVLPYPSGGFAWSPSGEQLVIVEGSTLSIYSAFGEFLGSVANEAGLTITAPAWSGNGIFFLEVAPAPAIRRIAPELFAP